MNGYAELANTTTWNAKSNASKRNAPSRKRLNGAKIVWALHSLIVKYVTKCRRKGESE